jgi:hypothetical protein
MLELESSPDQDASESPDAARLPSRSLPRAARPLARTRLFSALNTFLSRWNIALLVMASVFAIEARFENAVYDSFVAHTLHPGMSDRDKALALLHATSKIFHDRRDDLVTVESPINTFKTRWFRSGDTQLLLADEACGGAAAILVEASHRAGLEARLCQMRDSGVTRHVVAELFIEGKWVVADPSFDQFFLNRDGSLAGFEEIGAHWDYFKTIVAPDYESHGYTFKGVRRTDWNKIPILLPALKQILRLFIGSHAVAAISLRSMFLNLYSAGLYVSLLLLVLINANVIRLAIRRRPRT